MNTSQKIILSLVGLLIIASAAYLVFFIQDSGENIDNGLTTPGEEEIDDEEENIDTSPVFEVSGTVTEVGNDYVIIRSDGSQLGEEGMVEIKANTFISTNVRDINNVRASLSDISVGQRVEAESFRDIRGLTELNASNIQILEEIESIEEDDEVSDSVDDEDDQTTDAGTGDSGTTPTVEDDPDEEDTQTTEEPERLAVEGDDSAAETSDDDSHHDPNEGLEEDTSTADVVFNTGGVITQVTSSYIRFDSNGSHMDSGEEVNVRANISEDSFYYQGSEQFFSPGTTIQDENGNEISASDLDVGDNVSVESDENIKNKTQFDASNIKVN